MRTRKPTKQPQPQQRDVAVFDRSVSREKLAMDLAIATTDASEHGLSAADIILELLLRGDEIAGLANERGEDLSPLEGVM